MLYLIEEREEYVFNLFKYIGMGNLKVRFKEV
jgi:hypothetical protein